MSNKQTTRSSSLLRPQFNETQATLITPATTSDPPGQDVEPLVFETNASVPKASSRVKSMRLAASQQSDSLNTQSSNVPEMTKALRAMMQPENLTQGDTQMQSPLGDAANDKASDMSGTPTCSEVSPSKPADSAVSAKHSRPILSQAVLKRLDKHKEDRARTDKVLVKGKGKQKKDEAQVLCQCGFTEEEDGMVCKFAVSQLHAVTLRWLTTRQVQCTYCDTWQHLHCHGYTGNDDPRIPAEHVCYQCLLGDKEGRTIAKLQDLAQKRRAMHLALREGLRSQARFAQDLGLSPIA